MLRNCYPLFEMWKTSTTNTNMLVFQLNFLVICIINHALNQVFVFPKKGRKLFNRIWEITDKYRLCFLQWLIYHLKYERSENWSFLVAWLIINLVYVLPKMGSLPKYIALTKHWCKESVSTFRYFPMLTDVSTHVKDIKV